MAYKKQPEKRHFLVGGGGCCLLTEFGQLSFPSDLFNQEDYQRWLNLKYVRLHYCISSFTNTGSCFPRSILKHCEDRLLVKDPRAKVCPCAFSNPVSIQRKDDAIHCLQHGFSSCQTGLQTLVQRGSVVCFVRLGCERAR